MAKFEIVMIGNKSVGKTSMLSALSKELDKFNLTNSLKLEPTTVEFKILRDKWNEMVELVENQTAFSSLEAAIEGTAVDFVDHKFNFIADGSTKADVVFVDTKGTLTGDLNQELRERVNNAFGIFCVINAAVMMECAPSKHARVNCPETVKRLLSDVYTDGDGKEPCFVSFILTKCESYMKNEESRKKLLAKFRKEYGIVIDMLKKADATLNITCIAIQTMGCVGFHRLKDDGMPEFKKTLADASLETKDCAYPLIVLLQNLIRAMDSGKSVWDKLKRIYTKVLEFCNLKKPIKDYLEELEKCAPQPKFFKDFSSKQ